MSATLPAIRRIATRALARFSPDAQVGRLYNHGENTVYRVEGRPWVLRVHRRDYHAPAGIVSELNASGMPVSMDDLGCLLAQRVDDDVVRAAARLNASQDDRPVVVAERSEPGVSRGAARRRHHRHHAYAVSGIIVGIPRQPGLPGMGGFLRRRKIPSRHLDRSAFRAATAAPRTLSTTRRPTRTFAHPRARSRP